MKNNLKIAIKFNLNELKSKEKIIFAYQPSYEEVRRIVSDLYVLGSICEKLESQGLIAIDKKEKAYFIDFKEYDMIEEVEKNKDQFVTSSLYFEELYETCIGKNQILEIVFKDEKTIENPYIIESINKWKIEY